MNNTEKRRTNVFFLENSKNKEGKRENIRQNQKYTRRLNLL